MSYNLESELYTFTQTLFVRLLMGKCFYRNKVSLYEYLVSSGSEDRVNGYSDWYSRIWCTGNLSGCYSCGKVMFSYDPSITYF